MAATSNRVAIVGAGIGGAAAAVALRQAGVDVALYERGRELGEVGSGFFVWANGMRALSKLGVSEAVETNGEPVEGFEYLTWKGKVLVEWPVGRVAKRLEAANVGVTRSELQRAIADAAGDSLQLGREFTSFTQDGSGVTLQFADGGEERADALVGADGFHSRVAEGLGLQPGARYGGYSVFRGITQLEHPSLPRRTFRQHLGSGLQFLYLTVGKGRVYWAASKLAPQTGSPPSENYKEWLLDAFSGFTDPIPAMIEATDEQGIRWIEIFDREPKETWGQGRASLLGDAAHAMLPTMAQGACQSLEDAVVLGACFAEQRDPVAALRTYEERRIGRANSYVEQSAKIAKMAAVRNPIMLALRNRILKRVVTRMIPRREEQLAATAF